MCWVLVSIYVASICNCMQYWDYIYILFCAHILLSKCCTRLCFSFGKIKNKKIHFSVVQGYKSSWLIPLAHNFRELVYFLASWVNCEIIACLIIILGIPSIFQLILALSFRTLDFKSIDTMGLLLVIGGDRFLSTNGELWMFHFTGLAVTF